MCIRDRHPVATSSASTETVELSDQSVHTATDVEGIVRQPPNWEPSPPPVDLNLREVLRSVLPDAFKVLGEKKHEDDWDSSYINPCFTNAQSGTTHCVPYFYVLGTFHCGARDLFDRISTFTNVFRPPDTNPYFFSEVHPWDSSPWRGCDFGHCPQVRGMGATPPLGTHSLTLHTSTDPHPSA
eukprot:9314918-Pyramimonas_sp.AAC.1